MTKLLWLVIPFVFLLAVLSAVFNPGRKPQPEAKVRMIVVKANPSDPEDVARAEQKIKEIYEFLENGAEFTKVAATKSEAQSASEGGDMGWIGKGVLSKSLEDVIFELEPGQYSEVIQDHAGESIVYRIVYVEQRRNF